MLYLQLSVTFRMFISQYLLNSIYGYECSEEFLGDFTDWTRHPISSVMIECRS
ncbi:hypothetical protein Syun_028899 [Stephania yunnanensis]|uniref:Uncharacterized protein n=1 Tax=Stephania yunnanensis TaxID=152371 RepID=A0AAP0HKW2_9MAGN